MVNQPFSVFRCFKILVTLTNVFRAFANRPFTLPKTILCLLNLVLVAHHHIQWSRESVWVIFMMSVILSFNTFLNFGTSTRWAAIILAPVPCFGGFCSIFMIFFRIITNLKQLNDQNIFLRIIYLLIKIYIYISYILISYCFYHFQEGKFKIKDFIVVIKHNAMRF